MKTPVPYVLILTCILALQPLYAAERPEDDAPNASTDRQSAGSAAVNSVSEAATADKKEAADKKTADAASSAKDKQGKEAAANKTDTNKADSAFASIHNKGLTVAEGNRWYYESFDRHGRPAFAVLYENGTAIEKTVWMYNDTARSPAQKKILRTESSEIFRYDSEGRALVIEHYKGEDLTSKTENVYNNGGKLIEQTVTIGKTADKSVWEFAGDKAISQTKYRNGTKTAFIELHNDPHIVHLYVDDKEVFVGEEQ